jgi:hypothetical protein
LGNLNKIYKKSFYEKNVNVTIIPVKMGFTLYNAAKLRCFDVSELNIPGLFEKFEIQNHIWTQQLLKNMIFFGG